MMLLKMILWFRRLLLGRTPVKPLEDQIMDKYLNHRMLKRCRHYNNRLEYWQRYWEGEREISRFAQLIDEFMADNSNITSY
jgi:hypothetical protein